MSGTPVNVVIAELSERRQKRIASLEQVVDDSKHLEALLAADRNAAEAEIGWLKEEKWIQEQLDVEKAANPKGRGIGGQ